MKKVAVLTRRIVIQSTGEPILLKRRTAMRRSYKIATKKESGKLVEFMSKNGQAILPILKALIPG